MFVFGTYQMVANAYDVFLYTGRFLEPWGFTHNKLFYGLNLGGAISFVLAVFMQDGMLVSLRKINGHSWLTYNCATNGRYFAYLSFGVTITT